MTEEIKPILVLTTIGCKEDPEHPENWPDDWKDRAVGWFPLEHLQMVEEGLAQNMGDLEEAGWYQWAVIEETPCGLYGVTGEYKAYWYKFDREREGFFPHDAPVWSKNTVGFGLG